MTRDTPAPEPITRWGAARRDGAMWIQGTGVAVGDHGILILGASGSGKSSLALDLVALGAALIADDGIWLYDDTDPPTLTRPAQSPDLIEARGVGLLRAEAVRDRATLCTIVDLDRPEAERLPPRRLVAIGRATCPLIRGAGHHRLAPALILIARQGRAEV